jgi:hypothetical protein
VHEATVEQFAPHLGVHIKLLIYKQHHACRGPSTEGTAVAGAHILPSPFAREGAGHLNAAGARSTPVPQEGAGRSNACCYTAEASEEKA